MEQCERLLRLLRTPAASPTPPFAIPARWNDGVGVPAATDPDRPGEILVDRRAFLAAGIEHALQEAASGPQTTPSARADVTRHVIYGMLIRSFTAWPGRDRRDVASGTFLKTMALLPSLRRFDTDIVYLLPVFQVSDRYRKGELGSPYAIRDIYRLDAGLHDDALGPFTNELLEAEFAAFVELCHALGMKVVLDFAFRTAARDNALIAEHPDWFYWIRTAAAPGFRPPTIGDGATMPTWNDETLWQLYASAAASGYAAQFTQPPDVLNPRRWMELRRDAGDDILAAVEEQMGVTTVPGFSDVINDPQPAWTDATYLRYYDDVSPHVAGLVPRGQAPCIMQDGASLDRYHGSRPNQGLWDYVTEVLPFYRERFGIDGARIDMAHAMPPDLNTQMIRRIRDLDPDFLLWSEELDCSKGGQAQRDGFDLISGFTYYGYKRVHEDEFERDVLDGSFLRSPIPVAASVETPDTPRVARVHPDAPSQRLVLLLNCFMPNAVPCINSGQELLEVQPMNLGLDNTEEGRWTLSPDDPMAGKLAFFDRVCLHWTTTDTQAADILREGLRLRRAYMPMLSDTASFVKQTVPSTHDKLTMLCYHDRVHGLGLIVVANRSQTEHAAFTVEARCPAELRGVGRCEIVEDMDGPCRRPLNVNETLFLRPCEVVVLDVGD